MAIVAYSGLPGDGKSYSAVEHVILPALRKHRCVVTNLAVNLDAVKAEIPGADIRVFKSEDLTEKPDTIEALLPPGAVWVVDEAWQLFPAGVTAKEAPAAFKKMLNEHRHRVDEFGNSMQIVFLALDLAGIAAYARQLVSETFRVKKLVALGFSKRYRVDVYQGAVSGANPPKVRMIRQMLGTYRPEVYRFYKSHTKSQADGPGADEAKVDTRGVLWKSPVMYLGGPAVLVLLTVCAIGTWRFFHPKASAQESSKASTARASVNRPASGSRSVGAREWRIVMTVEGAGQDLVYMQAGDRWVSLPVKRYCDKDVSGFFMCEFEGQRISNQVRFLPTAPVSAPAGPGALLSSALPGE